MFAIIYYLTVIAALGLGYWLYRKDKEDFLAACKENPDMEALRQDKRRGKELKAVLQIGKGVTWSYVGLILAPVVLLELIINTFSFFKAFLYIITTIYTLVVLAGYFYETVERMRNRREGLQDRASKMVS